MEQYWIPLARVATILPLMHLVTMLMGRRSVGELPVFDFLVVLTMGSVVGADLADPAVAHGPTAVTVVAIGLLQYLLTRLKVNSRRVRDWATLTPTIVMERGQFLPHNLAKIRYTVNDVLPQLRQKDVFDLSEVELAVVEPSGKISVRKKSAAMPVTPADLGLKIREKGIPRLLIVEGVVLPGVLAESGIRREWLDRRLAEQNLALEDVYLAALEGDGRLYLSANRQGEKGAAIYY